MIDQITLQRILYIHPKLRDELQLIYAEICSKLSGNLGCRFVQVLRTFEEQDALYAQGRTKPGPIVTNAPGGKSYHCFGLGIDFALINDINADGKISSNEIVWDRTTDLDGDRIIDWMEVVGVFLKYGWTWGASFRDYGHMEKGFGYSVNQLLKKYMSGDFIPGTKYLHI